MASIASETIPKSKQSRLRRLTAPPLSVINRLASRPLSLIGMIVVVVFVFMALFGPAVAPYKFDAIIKGAARLPPSSSYFFGTDKLGRDVFSRVLWGAREVIIIPGVATSIAVTIGAIVGMATAYYGGWID